MTASLVLSALGGLLLLVLLYDVLVTVFHPQGHGGPVNRLQTRAVWRTFRAFGIGRDGQPRNTWLSYCGPTLAVCTIVMWAVLLIVSYALVYYPFIGYFSGPAAGESTGWGTALYYSGYVATTLGIGDVTAPTPALRIATIVQALTGFALFGISVTYVLAVYRELAMASSLALEIDSYLGRGVERVAEFAAGPHQGTVNAWIDQTTRTLLRVTQAHSQYPVIHYFHPMSDRHAIVHQLGKLIEFSAAAAELNRRPGDPLILPPTLDALDAAIEMHVHEITDYVVPSDFHSADGPGEDVPVGRRYERVLAYLLYRRPGSNRLPGSR